MGLGMGKGHGGAGGGVVGGGGGLGGGIGGEGLGLLLREAGGGFFEGGVELAEFGVVREVEGFQERVGKVAGLLAGLLAAFGGEQELGEVAKGGGAAARDAVGGEGAEDAGHRAVNVVLGGRIVLEEAHFEQEVCVVFFVAGRGQDRF